MTHKARYIDGIKQWMPISPFTQNDPYWIFHKAILRGCYAADVDAREIRKIDGEWRTVAYIERECCQERIRNPLAYLKSFIDNPDMRLKFGSLVRDARLLNIPAYFVCHSADMQQFVVVRLPWDGKRETMREWNKGQYTLFIQNLGQQERKTA